MYVPFKHAFVLSLSKNPENTVFAIVRDKQTIREAEKLEKSNVHILEADVTKWETLKVVYLLLN